MSGAQEPTLSCNERSGMATLKLKASSGYSSTTTARISPNQYGRLCEILNETDEQVAGEQVRKKHDALVEFYLASMTLHSTVGHPDASLADEEKAEKRYREGVDTARIFMDAPPSAGAA